MEEKKRSRCCGGVLGDSRAHSWVCKVCRVTTRLNNDSEREQGKNKLALSFSFKRTYRSLLSPWKLHCIRNSCWLTLTHHRKIHEKLMWQNCIPTQRFHQFIWTPPHGGGSVVFSIWTPMHEASTPQAADAASPPPWWPSRLCSPISPASLLSQRGVTMETGHNWWAWNITIGMHNWPHAQSWVRTQTHFVLIHYYVRRSGFLHVFLAVQTDSICNTGWTSGMLGFWCEVSLDHNRKMSSWLKNHQWEILFLSTILFIFVFLCVYVAS